MKVSKFFKVSIVFVLTLSLVVMSFSGFAEASSNKEKEKEKFINDKLLVSEIPEEVQFDLESNEKQEITYIDESGKEVTFGIEPVVEENDGLVSILCVTNCSSPISTGTSTWNIYHYSGAINMSYKIKVVRNSLGSKITDAYDLSITLVGYGESNRKFEFNSKKAEYSGTATLAKVIPFSLTIWLIAEINGNTLTTRAKS